MKAVWTIFKPDLRAYFATRLAYIFIVIFLTLAGAFTFFTGGFFERGPADMQSFFIFHPWLYVCRSQLRSGGHPPAAVRHAHGHILEPRQAVPGLGMVFSTHPSGWR
ncbi:MAG: hypothetical protein WAS21_29585 [Geminicoccaceae bacterium]